MAAPWEIAATQLGRREAPDRAALQDYLKTGGVNLDPATTAWCAAFVNASLGQAGIKGTGSNLARSFLNYGEKVDQPQKGDIAVFTRGDPNGPYGHVGFFEKFDERGRPVILAGNQGNSVAIAAQDPGTLLGYRRVASNGNAGVAPSEAPKEQAGGYGALSSTPLSIQSPGALGMGPQGLQVGGLTAGMPEQPMTLPTAGSLSMSTGLGSGSLGSSTGGGILDGLMQMAGGGGGQAAAEEPSDHAETHKAMMARAGQNNTRQIMAQSAQRRAQKDAMVLANKPILS